jgi:hypothetical protein
VCIGRTAEGVISNGTEDQSEARAAAARRGPVRAGDRGIAGNVSEEHHGVHNTIWVDTGNHNMREHATMTQ